MRILNISKGNNLRANVVAQLKGVIANENFLAETVREYVDCVKGCSVKMILGWPCGQNRVDLGSDSFIQKDLMALALSRIEKFAFVGFQEHWEESVRAFLAKFGGTFSDDLLSNNRKGKKEFSQDEIDKVATLLEQPEYHDKYDQELYQHAFSYHWKQKEATAV